MIHPRVVITLLLTVQVVLFSTPTVAMDNSRSQVDEILLSKNPIDTVPLVQNRFKFHISFPHVNSFHLRDEDFTTINSTGFWGISFGIEWHASSKAYYSLRSSAITNFYIPIPASPNQDGTIQSCSALSMFVQRNQQLTQRLSFGYGLSYARYSGSTTDYDQMPNVTANRFTSHSIGLVGDVYAKVFDPIYVGLIYKPSIARVNPAFQLLYEHTISLDFVVKL